MNKKYFKEAVDEIHVDEKIKKETIKKFQGKKHYGFKLATAIATILLVIIGISAIKPGTNNPTEITVETLPTVESFDNLYAILKKSASKNKYSGLKGVIYETAEGFLATNGADSIASEANTESKSLNDYSKTNTQVEGVDEADIVKTDGKNIYYVDNGKIVIVNALNPEKIELEAEIEYEKQKNSSFNPSEIYIIGKKLVVIGSKYVSEEVNKESEYYYGYYYGRNYTVAKIYNIENTQNIKLLREVELEGNYISSRVIGNNVYLIANKNLNLYRVYNTKIEDIAEQEYQVQYKDTAVSNAFCPVGYEEMYYFPDGEYSSYINIAAFDVSKTEEANIKTFLGAGSDVYCSQNNLYITNEIYEYKNYGFYEYQKQETIINKIALNGTKIEFVASGVVPGTPINQFAMDEAGNGNFRIATTKRTSWNNETNTNNMYVLDEKMNIVGTLEGLAPGERIYSVRFMGSRAYMVTFVQTDPLFVIDLSNPKEPTVLGELKIPGYSKYLHPYDETHLIGFGEDTITVDYGYGEVVKTNGMKMALFDVSDPNNPKELFNEKIGEQGTYSELLNNHKALLFSKEKNIIAFPITIRDDNYKTSFQGAIVYGLSLKDGFTLKGKITHKAEVNGKFQYDYTKEIQRIIYIKNNLFTLSRGLIKSVNMETLEEQSSVEIQVPEERYYYSIID